MSLGSVYAPQLVMASVAEPSYSPARHFSCIPTALHYISQREIALRLLKQHGVYRLELRVSSSIHCGERVPLSDFPFIPSTHGGVLLPSSHSESRHGNIPIRRSPLRPLHQNHAPISNPINIAQTNHISVSRGWRSLSLGD